MSKSAAKIFNDYFTSIIKHLDIEWNAWFSFQLVNYVEILTELKKVDMSKVTQLEAIPTKTVKKKFKMFCHII